MISSTSAFVRPFLSAFCTYRGYTLANEALNIRVFIMFYNTIGLSKKLKLAVLWCSRKRDHIADVGHAAYEQYQPLKTKTKAGMRARAKATRIQVPRQFF